MINKRIVSIVIPAFNEAESIPVIINQIKELFSESLTLYEYEIIFVADSCTDQTIDIIKQLLHSSHIFYIEFSRNFGHQVALKAGMDNAKGDCVISMDCDLQHPVNLIPLLLSKWEQGYEVVYTVRQEDKHLPYTKRISSWLYYKLFNGLSPVKLETGSADFRLLDRKVVDILKHFREQEPFLRSIVKWIGFSQYAVQYKPANRFAGKTKYCSQKMLHLAFHGLLSFSLKPLYIPIYLGLLFTLASALYAIYMLGSGQDIAGLGSLIMTVIFFSGLQLFAMGVLGAYLGKTFMQTKDRPSYIVRSTNLNNN